MAWTEADIPDLTGRTAVVTGANGGLGLQTALALASAGAHVVPLTSATCLWCRRRLGRSWPGTSASICW